MKLTIRVRRLIVFLVIREITSPPTWKIILPWNQFRLGTLLYISADFLRRIQFPRVAFPSETKLRCRPKIRNRLGRTRFPDDIPNL